MSSSLYTSQTLCTHNVRTFVQFLRHIIILRLLRLQIPVVVQEAKAALAGGHCVVIGLQATGEAAAQVRLLCRRLFACVGILMLQTWGLLSRSNRS
jgi:hypothetical protein